MKPPTRIAAACLLSLPNIGAASAFWEVRSGDCKVIGDCVESPSYPVEYPAESECRIDTTATAWEDHKIDVVAFQTEGCCDFLTVNAVQYSAARGPENVKPTGEIEWKADKETARTGW